MPYVRVETDVWLSPEQCGTAISKGDMEILLRFIKAARLAVNLMFDDGHHNTARELSETGLTVVKMFDLGIRWEPYKIDEKYRRWQTARSTEELEGT